MVLQGCTARSQCVRAPSCRRFACTPRCSASTAAPPDCASLKLRLLRVAACSDRGQLHNNFVWGASAYVAERAEAASLVAALEAAFVGKCTPSQLDGDWELTYASGQLFRSSPFFLVRMALRRRAELR